jgi:hypothetical protein
MSATVATATVVVTTLAAPTDHAAVVGTSPPIVEGEVMGNALAPTGGTVTGVLTGAAAARALAARIEAAVATFRYELAAARGGIHRLSEDTVNVVQLANHSTVVSRLEGAVEAVASAERDVSHLADVAAWLYATATAYDRLNT